VDIVFRLFESVVAFLLSINKLHLDLNLVKKSGLKILRFKLRCQKNLKTLLLYSFDIGISNLNFWFWSSWL